MVWHYRRMYVFEKRGENHHRINNDKVGLALDKNLDQYLSSVQVLSLSIQALGRLKISMWTLNVCDWSQGNWYKSLNTFAMNLNTKCDAVAADSQVNTC